MLVDVSHIDTSTAVLGLPLGIGFNNIEEHEAKAELEREQQRAQGTASQQPSED